MSCSDKIKQMNILLTNDDGIDSNITRALFEKELKSKTILMGFGLDSDAIHSPNESFHVKDFYRGIKTSARFFQLLAEDAKA